MKIGCVLLAAGEGRRFGGGKLLSRVDGEPMIERALRLYAPVPFPARVCVVRPEAETIPALARERGFSVFVNPDPSRGGGTSGSIGTSGALSLEPKLDGVLYAVSDQPFLTRESVLKLMEAFECEPQRIASLSFGGRRGNPAIFPRSMFVELEALCEDVGGGAVIRRHPELLKLVEAGSMRELEDVDTRESIQST